MSAALPPVTAASPHPAGHGWRADAVAGFLVFLIALPLCLAIANASCFPPVAGVITAIVGGLVTPWLTNSQLTIKGPAAGLIVICAGAAQGFGWTVDDPEAQLAAYRCVLAVGVVSGVLQVGLALLRSGIVSELFPTAVVHGMLASIGIIIISKQSHLMLGVQPHGTEPLHLLAEIPTSFLKANPEIAFIGLTNLLLLFCWPLVKAPSLKRIPAPLIVLLLSIPLASYLDLDHPTSQPHEYQFGGHIYAVSDEFLVAVPASLLGAMTTPDFSRIMTPTGLLWIIMFCLIGSLESILSAKAIDAIDPQRRRTDFNRDLLAIGVANAAAACIGGLPMISEIVRSRANIDNGAQSRFSNLFHALFLLVFLVCLPGLLHRIPLAALAAMLVYTGFRLASPREFMHAYHVGWDQLAVFVVTLVSVLATDLLIGILIGTAAKLVLHFFRGASVGSMLRSESDLIQLVNGELQLNVTGTAVFSNWLSLRSRLMNVTPGRRVTVDFSNATLVDSTVLEKLNSLKQDLLCRDVNLVVCGLDQHRSSSAHPLATRLRPAETLPDDLAPTAV